VVNKDKSMEAMIDSGEDWMIPLLEYRDWLAHTQDPEVKPEQREYKGRNGRVKITETGKLRWRTYTLDFSKVMLRKLLETQEELKKEEPDFSLISLDELREIRRLWLLERQDWADSLPEIYSDVTGKQAKWEQSDIVLPGQLEESVLGELSEQYAVPFNLLQKLIDAEWQHHGMRRRATIHKTIEAVFKEDWRSWSEIQDEILSKSEADPK
jgi:DNA sulfur modification protein DndC